MTACEKLAIVVPCYNEECALPEMAPVFREKLQALKTSGRVSEDSFLLFVNDGSKDRTWDKIKELSEKFSVIKGVSLSRNRGHQNALLAGLMTARRNADIVISADCDGQDDIDAIDRMLDERSKGADIVYGCRDKRDSDTFFKRFTALAFYRLMDVLGAEVVFNHADYRLVSSRALDSFADLHEVNLFLRGLFPLIGYKTAKVFYSRHERVAGESHYPLFKMLAFAMDGITSLSMRPMRFIGTFGVMVILLSLVLTIWSLPLASIWFLGGVQLLSLSVIGEYVGKAYLETKHRPRFVISDTVGGIPIVRDGCG